MITSAIPSPFISPIPLTASPLPSSLLIPFIAKPLLPFKSAKLKTAGKTIINLLFKISKLKKVPWVN